jgi:hypothetical protein
MMALLIFLAGATFGAFVTVWWQHYLGDTADLRSIRRHDEARRCGNRWL